MSEAGNDFDPLAPETFDSPHEEYTQLRAKCPVAHTDQWGGFWALTKFDDVVRALSEPETFITSVQNVVPKVSFTGRRPPLHLDPPAHTPYRRALNPLFTSARMAALEPKLREWVVATLGPLIERGTADIVEEAAVAYPVYGFSLFLNVSPEEMEEVQEVAVVYNRALQDFIDEEVKRTSLMLYDIARRLIEKRKKHLEDPAVDPTSALLMAKDFDGNPLPDEMILGTLRQVLVVGIIAPSVTIGSFVIHLSRHQDLQQELRESPEKIAAALEELLRLYTPYRGFARTANKDVEIGGRLIKKDEPIALLYASANRDETVFEDASEFRWDRERKDHLAFGRGPHNCAGAPMARLELRIFLEELLRMTSRFEVAGEIRPTRWPEYGALSVPTRFYK
jgi:cytochrome P450